MDQQDTSTRTTASAANQRMFARFAELLPSADTVLEGNGIRWTANPLPLADLSGLLLPSGPVDLARMRVLAAEFVQRGRPWSITVLGEVPDGVQELAAELGLTRTDEPTLVLPFTEIPPAAPSPREREEYRLVRTDEDRALWATTCDEGFGGRRMAAQFLTRELTDDPRIRAVLALRDGRPVATGLTVLDPTGWVGIRNIATVPDARRLGVAERLVRFLLRVGATDGGHAAYLQASEQALALYLKLGFRDAAEHTVVFEALGDDAAQDPIGG